MLSPYLMPPTVQVTEIGRVRRHPSQHLGPHGAHGDNTGMDKVPEKMDLFPDTKATHGGTEFFAPGCLALPGTHW